MGFLASDSTVLLTEGRAPAFKCREWRWKWRNYPQVGLNKSDKSSCFDEHKDTDTDTYTRMFAVHAHKYTQTSTHTHTHTHKSITCRLTWHSLKRFYKQRSNCELCSATPSYIKTWPRNQCIDQNADTHGRTHTHTVLPPICSICGSVGVLRPTAAYCSDE